MRSRPPAILLISTIIICSHATSDWITKHVGDNSILHVIVSKGQSFENETHRFVTECGLDASRDAIIAAFHGRYHSSIDFSRSVKAPVDMEVTVSIDSCIKQHIFMTTSSGIIHDFGDLIFDANDNAEVLASSECARISPSDAEVSVCKHNLSRSMRSAAADLILSPCTDGCPTAAARRRYDAALSRVAIATQAAGTLEDDDIAVFAPDAAEALRTLRTAGKLAISQTHHDGQISNLKIWPGTRVGKCSGPLENASPTTCILNDVYLMNSILYALDAHEHTGTNESAVAILNTTVPGGLRTSSDIAAPPLAIRRLSRAAFQDLRSTLGVPVQDANSALPYSDGVVAVLTRHGEDYHPGHVLTSRALAIYWAMHVVGLWTSDALPQTSAEKNDDSESDSPLVRVAFLDDRPAVATDAWLGAVSHQKPIYQLETEFCPRGTLCKIKRIVVGHAHLDWNQWRETPVVFAPIHRSFAVHSRHLLGLSVTDGPRVHDVLIIQRLHSRIIPEVDSLAEAVGADLVVALDHMPIREQLQLFSDSRVIVAVDGGALDLALLARPATGFITIKRPNDRVTPAGCQGCHRGGPDGQCCDWHLDLFSAANGTWLAAESLNPGSGLTIEAADLRAAIDRVQAHLRTLPEYSL